jgi:transcriptional regulator with XRE-family HTH domain
MQAQFGLHRSKPPASVIITMKIDAKQVGKRIADCRAHKGHETYSALAKALRGRTGTKKPTDETVRLWERGEHIPPYEMVDLLSLELGEPGEWILFGIKRDQQLREERHMLEYVSSEELDLLNQLRHTAKEHRALLIEQASTIAKRYPAPLAQVKRLHGGSKEK